MRSESAYWPVTLYWVSIGMQGRRLITAQLIIQFHHNHYHSSWYRCEAYPWMEKNLPSRSNLTFEISHPHVTLNMNWSPQITCQCFSYLLIEFEMIKMRRRVHNPAFLAYGLKTRTSTRPTSEIMQPPRPWRYLQFFYPVELRQLSSMQYSLTFKTCNSNVEDVRASQWNGVTTRVAGLSDGYKIFGHVRRLTCDLTTYRRCLEGGKALTCLGY